MTFEHLQPLAHILANRYRVRFSNPFTTKNAVLLTLILGTVLALTVTIDNLTWVAADGSYWLQLLFALLHNMLLSGLAFGLCFIIYGRCLKTLAPAESAVRYIVFSIVGSLLVAFLFSIVSRWCRRTVFNDLGITDIIGITTLTDALVAAGAMLITTLFFTLTRHQVMVLANEQLQSERLLTCCEALEQQVNPHFLFNSLNTLGGLIGVDDENAQHYLQQLAATYRYIMQQHENHAVAFADELAFVDTYCSMMQIRYGSNLQVVRHIAPATLHRRVPPISVQLLVENAIKHNVISDRHPLTITLETVGDDLLRVSNPLQPKQDEQDSTERNPIGLNNLNERYKMLFQREIRIEQTSDTFTVQLPLIQIEN